MAREFFDDDPMTKEAYRLCKENKVKLFKKIPEVVKKKPVETLKKSQLDMKLSEITLREFIDMFPYLVKKKTFKLVRSGCLEDKILKVLRDEGRGLSISEICKFVDDDYHNVLYVIKMKLVPSGKVNMRSIKNNAKNMLTKIITLPDNED